MRISDWSSDVCSSDLPGREPPPSGGADDFLAFIEHELKPLIAQRYPVDARRQILFGHSYGGLFTLYTLFTKQIGRASCRERVRKYVLISVVAATLKTKKL